MIKLSATGRVPVTSRIFYNWETGTKWRHQAGGGHESVAIMIRWEGIE